MEQTLLIANRPILVRVAALAEIVDLRHRILRQGLPRSAAIFDGDDAPTSSHYAAFAGAAALCCASFHLNSWESQPAFQLRGMATDDGQRGQGLGAAVLQLAERHLQSTSPLRLLWCNARTPAIPFYQKQGWTRVGELFHIETAGPHYKMYKQLAAI